MRYEATARLLQSARRRLWLQGLANRGWFGSMLASGTLGLAAALHTFHMSLPLSWWLSAALLVLAAAVATAMLDRPSPEASAAAADRWLGTQELFSAARYLRSGPAGPASTAACVVLDRAERVAKDARGRLPRLRNPCHPLPTALTVAVAASSLFFLSLQGAAPPGGLPDPPPEHDLAFEPALDAGWLSALDAAPGAEAIAGPDRPATREASAAAFATSPESGSQARISPDALNRRQDEPDPGNPGSTRQYSQGAGAGRAASIEPPRPAPGADAAAGAATEKDFEIVAVPRKPAGEATVTDRAASVGLLPVHSAPQRTGAGARDVPAARVTGEPPAPHVGPAFRALQIRYIEETSLGD